MPFDPSQLDLTNPQAVRDLFLAGAAANRSAKCRVGSIDRIEPPGSLIATGDLHDNPVHFLRLVNVAEMGVKLATTGALTDDMSSDLTGDLATLPKPIHLVLHEIIHSDRLINGMDFSYRALARVAALKALEPELVHTLLANHELSQVMGAGIVKDGVRVVEAFNEALAYSFGDDAPRVADAINVFVRSMPLALRCVGARSDILVAHSLPSTAMMGRFDPGVLNRDLTNEDYEPRRGAAHIMVWGRGYDAEQIEDLVERWGVSLILVGHEHAENGAKFVPPSVVILNSDHERGVYLPIDLSHPPTAEQAMKMVRPLGEGGNSSSYET